jgi:hypothetical protein
MSLTRTLQTLKTAALFGGILGLGFGCVVTFEDIEPCDTGSNNKINDQGECECRIGYEWCNPADEDDLNCCREPIGGDGDGDGDGDPTTGDGDGDPTTGDGDGDPTTGDGDGDGDPGTLPPENCSAEEEGSFWCTHDEDMGPEGSRFFICEDGSWVENTTFLDTECQFINYDFAYGCVDDGSQVVPICGDGSGDACNADDPAFCVDNDQIAYCDLGKETWDSCQAYCADVGVDGITFEYGECDDSVPGDVACFCCDPGDEGCPV